MKLDASETELTGQWVSECGRVISDAVARRIEVLIASHLRKIGQDPSGWDTLYIDPADGRMWEHVYPHGEMHGGGPPQLEVISREAALAKYGVQASRTD